LRGINSIFQKRFLAVEQTQMPRKSDKIVPLRDGTSPEPPAGLGSHGIALWCAVHGEYRIDDAPGLEILRGACEAIDRAEAAKAEVLRDGMTVERKTSSLRPHPALAVEYSLRGLALRHLNSLGVNAEPKRDRPGRPPVKSTSPFAAFWRDDE
jgi:hypothetical protein